MWMWTLEPPTTSPKGSPSGNLPGFVETPGAPKPEPSAPAEGGTKIARLWPIA